MTLINQIEIAYNLNETMSQYPTARIAKREIRFHHSNINNFKKKGSKAAMHITPFIIKLFNINKSELTKSIASCVVALDNLAIQIDTLIDSPNSTKVLNLSMNNFENLEEQIIHCLIPLQDLPEFEKLCTATLKSVNISLEFNTKKRHLVYNLNQITNCEGCTIMYLYPLFQLLTSLSRSTIKSERIFMLIANYVQILDDFIDVYYDIQTNNATPITELFSEIKSRVKSNSMLRTPFELLTQAVKQKLRTNLILVEYEINKICNGNDIGNILLEWNNFNNFLEKIQVPDSNLEYDHNKYLHEINKHTPPMLCYGI